MKKVYLQYASLYAFFMSNTFKSHAMLELAKIQVNTKQHSEAERLKPENYSHSSSTLSSNNNRTNSEKEAKEQACLYSWDYAHNYNENEDENENRFT